MVLLTKDFFIIIADDDTDDQSFILDALRRNDFPGVFKCLSDGAELVSYLKNSNYPTVPGLIVLDLNMPFKDGYTALAEIKKEPLLKEIPVAVLTSSVRSEDEKKCYAMGCDKYYQKPLSLSGYDKVAENIIGYLRSL